jgi:opine dehydrogenase
VLGAGAGGTAATAQLIQRGHGVSLWSRSPETTEPLRAAGGVSYDGALGTGTVSPTRITNDLAEALDDAEIALVCLPSVAHESLAQALAACRCDIPILLNPGGTGGALLFRRVFRDARCRIPPIAELSTLTFIARKTGSARVSIFATAKLSHVACLPGGHAAAEAADALFEGVRQEPNVLATSLRNINLVLHPPVALLSAAWVEATHGDFLIYSQAVTPGVYRLIETLDGERRALGSALGLKLAPLVEEMAMVGSVDRDALERGRFREAISGGEANRTIKAPESLRHRYYEEDLGYAVVPFTEIARICRVPTPIADGILTIASAVLGFDVRGSGLTARRLGIGGLDHEGLLQAVGDRAT